MTSGTYFLSLGSDMYHCLNVKWTYANDLKFYISVLRDNFWRKQQGNSTDLEPTLVPAYLFSLILNSPSPTFQLYNLQ